jgi:hypothetical protein
MTELLRMRGFKQKQRERLESNLRENRAMGKEGKTNHKVIKTVLGKKEMAVCR